MVGFSNLERFRRGGALTAAGRFPGLLLVLPIALGFRPARASDPGPSTQPAAGTPPTQTAPAAKPLPEPKYLNLRFDENQPPLALRNAFEVTSTPAAPEVQAGTPAEASAASAAPEAQAGTPTEVGSAPAAPETEGGTPAQ